MMNPSAAQPQQPATGSQADIVDGLPATGPQVQPSLAAVRMQGKWMIVRGLLAFAFGIVSVFWPREQIGSPANLAISVSTVDYLLVAFLGVQAILLVVQSRFMPLELRLPVLGQAVVTIPAIGFLLFSDSAAQLRAAVCVWAILFAGLEFLIWRMCRDLKMSSDFLLNALIHAALGLVLILGSSMGALTVLGFTGAASLMVGVLYSVGGVTRQTHKASRLLSDDVIADLARRESAAGPGVDTVPERATVPETSATPDPAIATAPEPIAVPGRAQPSAQTQTPAPVQAPEQARVHVQPHAHGETAVTAEAEGPRDK